MIIVSGPSVVRSGLVLHLDAANPASYPSGGTAWYDVSGSGNNGSLVNGPAYSSVDKGNISLDGSNDYIQIPSSESLNFGTSDYSVSLWINPASSSLIPLKEYGVFGKNAYDAGNAGWGIEVHTYGISSAPWGFIYVSGWNGAQSSWGNTNVGWTISTNIWSNICFLRSSTTHFLYLNGSLVSSKTASEVSLSVSSSTPLVFGNRVNYPNYVGKVSDILVHNRALTLFEVQQNFNSFRSRYGI